MPSPEIIKKEIDALLKDIEGKAPFYTPEWKYGDQNGPGAGLAEIFAYLSGIMIKRLNQAPYRHFLGFLELIGSSLLPAQSAKAPLTFVPARGTPENVLIPALTQASAAGADGKPVIFETENNTVATSSKLLSVYSVIKDDDAMFDHKNTINGISPSDLFMGDNRQEHILYIGDKNLFNIKNAVIVIDFTGNEEAVIKNLASKDFVSWEYGVEVTEKQNGSDIKKSEWHQLSPAFLKNAGNAISLSKENDESISEIELLKGIKSRWIRCRAADSKIEELKNIKMGALKIAAMPGIKKTFPVKMVQGIGDAFHERLAGEDVIDKIETVEELLKLTPDELSKKLSTKLVKCSRTRAVNILEAAQKVYFDKTGAAKPAEIKGIAPDAVFCNDVPVNFKNKFYPFGSKPQLYSSCYIASAEAFSKEGYEVTLNFNLSEGLPSCAGVSAGAKARADGSDSSKAAGSINTPQLSWEYWDGEGWAELKGVSETMTGEGCCNSSYSKKFIDLPVKIDALPAVKKTKVNGKENYWIRVRLAGGDFGKEYEIVSRGVQEGTFCPPEISSFTIGYKKDKGDDPEAILSKNNGETEIIKGVSFTPFKSLPDDYPSIYFGFDKGIKGGPAGLFAHIDERFEYPEGFRPRIKWEFYSGEGTSGWRGPDVLDGTEGFTKSGIIQFVFPAEMKALSLFGEVNLCWVRAVLTEDFFDFKIKDNMQFLKSGYLNVFRKYRAEVLKDIRFAVQDTFTKRLANDSSIEECRKDAEIYNLSLLRNEAKKIPPRVLGFFLNTVWAVQSKTVTNELLGSGTGEAGQQFSVLTTPVISERVWANEIHSLSEGDRGLLRKSGYLIEEKKDEKGTVIEFWIKWDGRDDLMGSTGLDRHYVIDRTAGKVFFGDGVHGMIPPIGKDNIKVTYSAGGGMAGNFKAFEISKLQSAVAFIDKVFNPAASEGGNDTEAADTLLKRAPSVLENRHRAVALEDFEWLTKEASRDIARVKVLPNFNDKGQYRTGWVTVVIVPEGTEVNPAPSPELRRKAEAYLRERCPNVASIRVIQPSYVRVDISAELITLKIEAIPDIEHETKLRLSQFLHPLAGGKEGRGREFGSAPCISDIYSLLEDIKDVDHIKKLSMNLLTVEGSRITGITDTTGIVSLPGYALTYSGEHDIAARF